MKFTGILLRMHIHTSAQIISWEQTYTVSLESFTHQYSDQTRCFALKPHGHPSEIQQHPLQSMLGNLHGDRRRTLVGWRTDWPWSDSETCHTADLTNRSGRVSCYNTHSSRRSNYRPPLPSDTDYLPSHVAQDPNQIPPTFSLRFLHLFVDL